MFTKEVKTTRSNIHINNNNKINNQVPLPLKDRFLIAVVKGEIGTKENSGVIVSLKEFKAYFNDITSDYINSFLPAATIEPGQLSATKTKYLFRVKKGVYLVHPEILEDYKG